MEEKRIFIPPEWIELATEIKRRSGATVIIGKTDSGKSTLSRFIVNELLKSGERVGLLDTDVGQQSIGLPTTIALGIAERGRDETVEIKCMCMRFIGSTSPVGFFVPIIAGVKALIEKSGHLGNRYTVVDTSGLVHGRAAKILKLYKIDIIKPENIVVINDGEMDPILNALRGMEHFRIFELKPVGAVRQRERETRKAYREKMFGEYFSAASEIEFPIESVSVLGATVGIGKRLTSSDLSFLSKELDTSVVYAERKTNRISIITRGGHSREGIFRIKDVFSINELEIYDMEEFENLLVGLNDRHLNTIALGIIIRFDVKKGSFHILTPLKFQQEVKFLQLGSLKLSSSGKELGRSLLWGES